MTTAAQEYRIGVIAVLVASVLWGTTGTAASLAPGVGPAAIGAAAMGFGGLMQAALAWRGIVAAQSRLARAWPMLALGALAVAVYPLAFYASMRLAGITVGTLVTIGSAPLASALIEWRADRTRLSPRWLVGAAVGLAGMALLTVAQAGEASATAPAPLAGIGLGLIGGLTYALYSWTARRVMLSGVGSRAAMGATFGLGGLLLMPVLLASGAPFLAAWPNAAVGLYMALVPMFLGYIAFGMGLARIPASLATTITLTEPVVAALLAVGLVGERLSPAGWLGVALICACLLIVTRPERRRATA